MMKKIGYGLLAFGPMMAFAAAPTVDVSFINTVATQLATAVKTLIPLVFGLAVLYFFWGIAKYILAAGDPEKAKEGKSIMIYGVIAIAVMASIWGLVSWLQGVTGVGTTATGTVPSYQ